MEDPQEYKLMPADNQADAETPAEKEVRETTATGEVNKAIAAITKKYNCKLKKQLLILASGTQPLLSVETIETLSDFVLKRIAYKMWKNEKDNRIKLCANEISDAISKIGAKYKCGLSLISVISEKGATFEISLLTQP